MKKTTLCYIEKEGSYLMLFRNKKDADPCLGKWVGIGGKFEPGEDADACLLREVFEETGLVLTNYGFRGIIHFVSNELDDEDMYLFTADGFSGDDPARGILELTENADAPRAARVEEESVSSHLAGADENKPDAAPRAWTAEETPAVASCRAMRVEEESAPSRRAGADENKPDAADRAWTAEETPAVASCRTVRVEEESVPSRRASSPGNSERFNCSEGELWWVRKEDVTKLNLWEGDKYFLKPLINGEKYIEMTCVYEGDRLVKVAK